MDNIKCDTCIFLGGRHNSGVIPIQSGALRIEEPYATCLKRQYFVLEREVDKCADYKNESDKIATKKGEIPYSFTNADVLAVFKPDKWISLDEVSSKLRLTDTSQIRYLPLILKNLVQNKQVQMKLGLKTLLYCLR